MCRKKIACAIDGLIVRVSQQEGPTQKDNRGSNAEQQNVLWQV